MGYPMSTNRSDPKLWRLLESVPTNTWPRCAVKTLSTCEFEPTHTTSPESTKCCPVPVPIGSKPVCEVPTVNPTVSFPESTSEIQSSLFEPKNRTTTTPTKLSDDPK